MLPHGIIHCLRANVCGDSGRKGDVTAEARLERKRKVLFDRQRIRTKIV